MRQRGNRRPSKRSAAIERRAIVRRSQVSADDGQLRESFDQQPKSTGPRVLSLAASRLAKHRVRFSGLETLLATQHPRVRHCIRGRLGVPLILKPAHDCLLLFQVRPSFVSLPPRCRISPKSNRSLGISRILLAEFS